MTDEEKIKRATARMLGDIIICFVAELDEYRVTVGNKVAIFSARYSNTRALKLARKFAQIRQQGTNRQILEITHDNNL